MKNRLHKNGYGSAIWPTQSSGVAEFATDVGNKAGRLLAERGPTLFKEHTALCLVGAFVAGIFLGRWVKQ